MTVRKLLVLGVLSALALSRCALHHWAAWSQGAPADDHRTQAEGKYITWLSQQPETHELAADSQGRWVAARNTERGWLSVWQIAPGAKLGECRLSTQGQGYIVLQDAWVAGQLVFCGIEGIDDYLKFEFDPPENLSEYLAKHRRTVSWAPDTASGITIADKPATALLATVRGDKLAIFDSTDSLQGIGVHVYCGPRFTPCGSLRLGTYPEYWSEVVPICWSADGSAMFLTATVRGVERSRRPGREPDWQVLLVMRLDGQVTRLTNATDTRLWGKGTFSVSPTWCVLDGGNLNVTSVEEGRLVACTLAPRGNTLTRLGFFDTGGLVQAYPLEREWYYGPKELRQDKQAMHTITITPDGRRLILQETDADSRLDYGEKGWVWA